jgi:hypothetical protein
MTSLTGIVICIVLAMCSLESSANLGSADHISSEIGQVLVRFMAKWFNKDEIEKIYNTQSYKTYTGENRLPF